jgi:hypothetical protein
MPPALCLRYFAAGQSAASFPFDKSGANPIASHCRNVHLSWATRSSFSLLALVPTKFDFADLTILQI